LKCFDTLRQLTGQSSDKTAWDALVTYYKTKRGQTGGLPTRREIAIKANMTQQEPQRPKNDLSLPGRAFALLTQLVQAGVKPDDITVYDASAFRA